MPEMSLDDVYKELNDPNEELTNAPGIADDFEPEFDEEHDPENLFDLDPTLFDEPDSNRQSPDGGDHKPMEESDLVTDLLRSKGITNPDEINFENENGELELRSFYDLSYTEQLEVLKSSDADIGYGLKEEELGAIDFLRENDVTFEEAIDYFQRKAVQEYIDSQNISGLEVDQYEDTDLFVLDLKTKFPDLTNDELDIELQKQLENPDVFKKKVDKLRTDYKEIEANQIAQARQEQEQEDEYKRKELEDTLVTTAISVEEIGGLTLDNDDKNAVLSYILEKDMNGVSPFIKSLNSPQTLFELAWFATNGKQAFNIIHDYYKKEIAQVSKTAFEKGRAAAGGTSQSTQETRRTYTRKNGGQAASRPNSGFINDNPTSMSINDLNID
jgi:hypothetical protein